MGENGFWARLTKVHVFRVFVLYIGASWIVLQVVGLFIATTGLPEWTFSGTVVLLLIGLVVLLATTWIQARLPPHDPEGAPGRARETTVLFARWGTAHPLLLHGRTRAAAAAVLLASGLAGYSILAGLHDRDPMPAEVRVVAADPGIVVLPFSVHGPGLEDWREGMMDLLSMDLDGAAGVRSVDSRTVLAQWAEAGGSSSGNRATSFAVARAVEARWALLGTAVGIGPNVRLVADVYSVDDGQKLGQVQVDGSPEEMHRLVDELALKVLDILAEGNATELPRVELAAVTTRSVPALKAFLEGEKYLRHGEFPDAIRAYDRAIREDSLFAYAYLRLAEAHGWNEARPGGAAFRQRTAELADRLPERQRFFALADQRLRTESDRAAIDSLIAATRRYPDDPGAWYLLGDAYYHFNHRARSPVTVREALGAFGRAVALDPSFAPYRIHIVELLLLEPEVDTVKVREALRELEGLSGQHWLLQASELAVQLAFGDSLARLEAWSALEAGDDALREAMATRLRGIRLLEQQEAVFRRMIERTPSEEAAGLQRALAGVRLRRGRLRAAVEPLDRLPTSRESPACALVSLELRGATLPESVVDRFMTLPEADAGGSPDTPLCHALFWIARERWSLADRSAERFRSRAATLVLADSTRSREMGQLLETLEAVRKWWAGRPDEAVESLERIRREGRIDLPLYLYADLYRDLGRAEDALTFYLGDWEDPLSHREAGLILTAMGRSEEARVHLEAFVTAWRDADPELQPLVEEARAVLARL